MRKNFQFLMAGAISILSVGCNPNANDELSHHDHGHEHVHGDTHNEEIILEPEAAERFGVKTKIAELSEFNEIIKVSGQIENTPNSESVVSAPTAGIVRFMPGIARGKAVNAGNAIAKISSAGMTGGDPNKTAKIALDAAKRELDRITPLHEDGIVSTRDYNEAVQAYHQAQAAYSSVAASGNAVSATSGTIAELFVREGQFVDAGTPIASISSNTGLTLRADLPERYYGRLSSIVSANIRMSYKDATIALADLNGRKVTSGNTAGASTPGYIPIYFTFDNDGSIMPGAIAEVFLIGESKRNAIVLPISALSEQQGNFYVYIKIDDEGYNKVLVSTGASDGKNIEISDGLKGGENVVVEGTTTIRLAENSGVVPEGHTHNH